MFNKTKLLIELDFKNTFQNFFTQGHKRSLEAKKNIIGSFLVKGTSITTTLIMVPLTIHYVNPSQYGIWLTLSSIIMWLSFFDIGFGNGLRNKLAEVSAIGDFEKAKTYVSTTYMVLFLIFSFIWVLFFIANFFINWSEVLNIKEVNTGELSKLTFILVSFFCIQFVLKIIHTIVLSDQKTALSGLIDVIGQILGLIIIFILTKTTEGSLINLGLALGFAPISVLIISSIFLFSKKYKYISPSIKYIDFSCTKEIMGLGIKFFFIQISLIVIFQTSNIVIIRILDPEQVTIFNLAYKYFFVLSMFFIIIMSPFWSAYTEAYTKKDFIWMQNTIKKLEKIWLLIIPILVVMVLLANIIYNFWIGDVVIIPLEVNIFMAIYVVFYTRFNLFMFPINGIGKIKLQLIVYILICIFYLPIAVYFCKWWGLKGIISANILVSIIHSIISQIQFNKIINDKAQGIWND